MCHFCSRAHSVGCQRNLVRVATSALWHVLNRAARKPGLRGQTNCVRDFDWFIGVTIFQIGTNRKIGRNGKGHSVRKHRLPVNAAIRFTNGERISGAGCGQGFKS